MAETPTQPSGRHGRNYCISSETGDDANPGTWAEPWRTLVRASAHHYESEDWIMLREGERFPGTLILSSENVTESEYPILIKSYHDFGAATPVIEAGDGDGIRIYNIGNVFIWDLEVRGSGYSTNTGWGVRVVNDAPGAGRLAKVKIRNVNATGFRWVGIYVGGVPNDLPGIVAPDECRYGFSDISITNCTANANMYYGIYVSGPLRPDMTEYANTEVSIQCCKTFDNHGDKWYTASHTGSGILLDNCATGLIFECEASRNGAENAGQTGGPCGIWAHASDRITISHCKSYENRTGGIADGTGFDLDGSVTNSVIEYCESWDNDGPGYLMWNYESAPFTLSGNTVRNCTSANDGRKHGYGGIHLGTSGEPLFDIEVSECRVSQSPAPGGVLPPCLAVEGDRNQNIVFRGDILTIIGGGAETRFPEGATGITVVP